MQLARIRRLLQILGQLQTSRGRNARSLGEFCGVTRRTIFRDLDLLRDAGVPLHYDAEDECFRIPGTFYLPPTNFTTEETLAVIVLCHEVGDQGQIPFLGAAAGAAAKLESSLPSRLRDRLGKLARMIQIRLGPQATQPPSPPQNGTPSCNGFCNGSPQHSIYESLSDAIAARRCVRIHYDSVADSQPIATRLSPYRLWFSRRAWYAIGRSSLHRGVRTFHLGRIRDLQLLDEPFRVPRGFSLERYLGNAWHMIPEVGLDQKIVIRFSALVARNVAEVAWHKTQRIVWNDDGTIDFQATVSGLNEISWWILGYGDQAQVVEPAKLRERVVRRARQLLANYENHPDAAAVTNGSTAKQNGSSPGASNHANGRRRRARQ